MVKNIFTTVKSMCEVHPSGYTRWIRTDRTPIEVITNMLTEANIKYNILDSTSYCEHNETIVHNIIVAWIENDNIYMDKFYVEVDEDEE